MSRFLDRYLPATERRTALWLAFGGAAVQWVAVEVGQQVMFNITNEAVEPSTQQTSVVFVAAAAQFAFVAVLVAALIRFARAPKVLALYLLLGSLVSTVASLGSPFSRTAQYAGIALGALAGAWIASTVSLARIQDPGFSGDAPDGKGLRTEHRATGWAFVGWEGRPPAGDGLVAVAMVAATVIPTFAGILFGLVMDGVMRPGGEFPGGAMGTALLSMSWSVSGVAWLFSVYSVVRKTGVRSAWLGWAPALASFATVVVWIARSYQGVPDSALQLLLFVFVAIAALAGAELAIRRQPATLADTPVAQDPDAEPPASDDTAGGTDG